MSHFPYDAVLFDLDGTLCNAEEGILSSMRYAMEQLHQPIPEGVNLRAMIGPPLYDSLVNLLGVPPALAKEGMELYRERFDSHGLYHYTVYPHIRALLRTLRQGGVFLSLATSKPSKTARMVLDHFGLTHYFDRIVGVDDDHHVIDKPELVRLALPKEYRRAAMVGDRAYDMQGAVANGIDGIGAGYGHGSEEELTGAGAARVVPDTASLLALLCPDAKPQRGFFLTMEGLDGSGKTTQVELLEKNLRAYGFDVLRTREPGGCAISEEIRQIILTTDHMEMCPACEALLYAAARAQHVHQVIRPAVEQGKLALCDRFVDSSIAYQGSGRELGMVTVRQINAPAVAGMKPDATVYLSIDHQAGLKRRYSASSPDRLEMEGSEFHARVEQAYDQLIADDPHRFLIVNAAQDIASVAKDALAAVLARLEPEMAKEREA